MTNSFLFTNAGPYNIRQCLPGTWKLASGSWIWRLCTNLLQQRCWQEVRFPNRMMFFTFLKTWVFCRY